ncbi:MAG: DUF362 domain-containing protein [Candidatus Margulisiibacteriota bacterium]
MPVVSIVRCNSYIEAEIERSVKEAVDLIGGISSFVRPGQKVLLKVNALMASAPETACPTHPAVVSAAAKFVLDLGAVPVIGDSPGGSKTVFGHVFETCGYNKVAKDLNIKTQDLKKLPVKQVNIKLRKKTISVPVADLYGSFDSVINLPKFKTHILTVTTGAVKNMFGSVPGFYKSRLHFIAPGIDDFSSVLLEVYRNSLPSLTIMDAVESMEGNGPSGGRAVKTGTVFASDSGLALDIVSARCAGFEPAELPVLEAAKRAGLDTEISGIRTVGIQITKGLFGRFKKPVSVYRLTKRVPAVLIDGFGFILRSIKNLPQIDKKKCIACQTCAVSCPAGCITIVKDARYDINYNKCVACFCCHELCPEKAVKIKKSLLARVLSL